MRTRLYYNLNRTKRVWYNSHIKSWTLQHMDDGDCQIGPAEYCYSRKTAMVWLFDIN